MNNDLEIAQKAKMKPIKEIAKRIGLTEDEISLFGKFKAKISLEVLERLKDRSDGKFIDITAITPTPLGEGKTVTAIGLAQALDRLNKNIILTLREPSMGPVFGIKGGACGGGYSQVVPMEDINLHFTGDIHAVGAAHNLLSAMVDSSLLHKNPLNINPLSVTWTRVVDISDRALRHIIIGLEGNGYLRETGYDITVASEVMAILALTTSLKDLRERLGRIVVGYTYDRKPITAEDLKAAGAMAALLKEAICPNLIQTLENTPCIMHAGPFANVAHGNNSILADMIALKLADYVVTESGFGADCGAEKMFDIKCRTGLKPPDCVVITASIRALKMHSGRFKVVAGKPLDPGLLKEDLSATEEGCENLTKHIENVKLFGVPVVVVINRFTKDTDREVEIVKKSAKSAGAEEAVCHTVWADGGKGGIELAKAVISACEKPNNFQFLYPLECPIKEKIETIATKIYGADGVDYTPLAEKKIKRFTKLGWANLPINMAKTHLSISDNPSLKGRPRNFRVKVADIRPSIGAGFLYPILGEMRTMPGLPSHPAAMDVDINEKGQITGLF